MRVIDKTQDFNGSKIMQDGSRAWLSASKKYYVRREYHSPKGFCITIQAYPWNHIEYYDLEGRYIPLAMARCNNCHDLIRSKHCGDFVSCSCKKSGVDTDRWFPERHRYIGDCMGIS